MTSASIARGWYRKCEGPPSHQIVRRRSLEDADRRVFEFPCVQHQHLVSDRLEVKPDLMRAARLNPHFGDLPAWLRLRVRVFALNRRVDDHAHAKRRLDT